MLIISVFSSHQPCKLRVALSLLLLRLGRNSLPRTPSENSQQRGDFKKESLDSLVSFLASMQLCPLMSSMHTDGLCTHCAYVCAHMRADKKTHKISFCSPLRTQRMHIFILGVNVN